MLIDYHVKHALNAPHGVYAEIIEVATNHLLHLTPLRTRERLVLLDVLAYVGRWLSERHLSPERWHALTGALCPVAATEEVPP